MFDATQQRNEEELKIHTKHTSYMYGNDSEYFFDENQLIERERESFYIWYYLRI